MAFRQELESWKSPTPIAAASVPTVASYAPSTEKLLMPPADRKPTILTFLRLCGDPFAEKSFRQFAQLSSKHPEIHFVAVSHSSQSHTDAWVVTVGGEWNVDIIIDEEREAYAAWGLGVSSAWYLINPWSIYSAFRLAKDEKIWNQAAESGNKWQMSGSFAVDGEGRVEWSRPAKRADDLPDFKEGLRSLGVKIQGAG